MRKVNRILAFIGVGFVLIFMAKISKADLFYAFTRTLEPLELRNSTAVASMPALGLDVTAQTVSPSAADSQPAALHASSILIPEVSGKDECPVQQERLPYIRLCQGMPPIRAP